MRFQEFNIINPFLRDLIILIPPKANDHKLVVDGPRDPSPVQRELQVSLVMANDDVRAP